MNKSKKNSIALINEVARKLELAGLTTDINQSIYYTKLTGDKDLCHLLLVGLELEPIKIKTANADKGANVSGLYIDQMKKIIKKGNSPLFIYAGDAWNLSNRYKEVITSLREMLDGDFSRVINVNELSDWIKQKLKEV